MDAFDTLSIAIYAGVVLWIGFREGRRSTTAEDLQLAGRDLPAWAVLASLSATELSAATFIGVPAAAYSGDCRQIKASRLAPNASSSASVRR